ncbi:winged helix-turn-helix domain-containing protein [Vibrio ziniensis]|uniref:OmpR/PhoB-type domain-containing protein n=1 Tax=Vibrio ziniensis TaxID=2711221 RepID=A0A6G7CLV0_9VIBR|nr:winged helix-turn-helix domain-containing protein [Vibrio ziniensis]QIH43026.1 hypothetical protein G5S32_14200 [Vibrio ziniensis]
MDANDIKIKCSEEGGSYFIIIDDVRYKCSYAESAILSTLLQNKGNFYSRDELAVIGWPGKLVSKNSVPVSMANLRKIFKNHTKLDVIENEKNKGYIITIDKIKLIPTEEAEVKDDKLDLTNVKITKPVLVNTDRKTKLTHIKSLISRGLAYPLFFVNMVFLLLVLFHNRSDLEPIQLSLTNSDRYIAVSTNDNNFLAKLNKDKINKQTEHHSFTNIASDLMLAKQEDKNIIFINSLGDRVIIDCLVNDKLESYSGDDIETIISELNEKGCEL